MENIIELCKKIGCDYQQNEPMKKHTTFKIGGNARLVVYPKNIEQISAIVKTANEHNVRLLTIGNGSNLLVSDDGIDACVIILGEHFGKIELIDEETIYAESGALLIRLCRFAYENGLTGLEFAYGIPGTCGGGAYMNAGAYSGEMKDVLFRCDHIDKNAEKGFLQGEDLKLSYRHSAYCDNGFIITGIYLKLKKGDKAEIKAKMDDLMSRRRSKQPLEFASAGSTFKRPVGNFAGALIEQCNLKGLSVGDAQVSEKHAGFVINRGNATCADVLAVCEKCKSTVLEKTGISLEMEVKVIS